MSLLSVSFETSCAFKDALVLIIYHVDIGFTVYHNMSTYCHIMVVLIHTIRTL